jgi:hypothetical protein
MVYLNTYEDSSKDAGKLAVVSVDADEQERSDAERWHAQFAASPSTLEEIYDDAMREYLAGNTIDIG